MAEVFWKVESGPFEGRKILRAVAGTEDVIEGIDHRAQRIAADARKVLRSTAGHDPHSPGYSNSPARISVEMASGPESKVGRGRKRGRYTYIDRFVVLSDERGMGAAMAIEFGISPGIDTEGNFYRGTRAVAPLRRAAELPFEERRRELHLKRKPNRRSRRFKLASRR